MVRNHAFFSGNVAIPGGKSAAEFKAGLTARALVMNLQGKSISSSKMQLTIILTNQGVGHDFPAGPADIMAYSLEYKSQESRGAWQILQKDIFRENLYDQNNTSLEKHQIWQLFHKEPGKSIPAGSSRRYSYTIKSSLGNTIVTRLIVQRYGENIRKYFSLDGLYNEPVQIVSAKWPDY